MFFGDAWAGRRTWVRREARNGRPGLLALYSRGPASPILRIAESSDAGRVGGVLLGASGLRRWTWRRGRTSFSFFSLDKRVQQRGLVHSPKPDASSVLSRPPLFSCITLVIRVPKRLFVCAGWCLVQRFLVLPAVLYRIGKVHLVDPPLPLLFCSVLFCFVLFCRVVCHAQ